MYFIWTISRFKREKKTTMEIEMLEKGNMTPA